MHSGGVNPPAVEDKCLRAPRWAAKQNGVLGGHLVFTLVCARWACDSHCDGCAQLATIRGRQRSLVGGRVTSFLQMSNR